MNEIKNLIQHVKIEFNKENTQNGSWDDRIQGLEDEINELEQRQINKSITGTCKIFETP